MGHGIIRHMHLCYHSWTCGKFNLLRWLHFPIFTHLAFHSIPIPQVTGVCCEEVPPKTEEEKKEIVEKEEELLRKELEEAQALEEEFPIEAQVINRQCGKTNHCNFNLRIVNGYETCTNEYPFMVRK